MVVTAGLQLPLLVLRLLLQLLRLLHLVEAGVAMVGILKLPAQEAHWVSHTTAPPLPNPCYPVPLLSPPPHSLYPPPILLYI